MSTWIGQIIDAITEAFTELSTAVFNCLSNGFTSLFLTTDTQGAVTGVSNFGIFSFVLMGISLTLGLTYFIVNLVRRKI